jgi:hypothetical protein
MCDFICTLDSTCFVGPLCNNQIRTQIYRPNRIQIQTGTRFSFETLVRTSTTTMCCLQCTVHNLRLFFGHCPRYTPGTYAWGNGVFFWSAIWNILDKFAENLGYRHHTWGTGVYPRYISLRVSRVDPGKITTPEVQFIRSS